MIYGHFWFSEYVKKCKNFYVFLASAIIRYLNTFKRLCYVGENILSAFLFKARQKSKRKSSLRLSAAGIAQPILSIQNMNIYLKEITNL